MGTLWQISSLFSLWVLVPLIPAVLIYSVFPKSVITTSGKLAGLTVRATGGFAGYFVILLVTYPVIEWGQNLIKITKNTYWHVRAPVELDTTGVSLDSAASSLLLEKISAEPIPNNSGVRHGWLELSVPDGQTMVGLYLYGSCVVPKTVYLADQEQKGHIKRDYENGTIEFDHPLKLGPVHATCEMKQ